MKIGKVPESVLLRSVLKQVGHRREEVLLGAQLGEDGAVLEVQEGERIILSTDPMTNGVETLACLSVYRVINDIAASGAKPIGILITVLLPEYAKESELKKLMGEIEEACKSLDIQILGGHTEVTDGVTRPLLSLTGVGKSFAGQTIQTGRAKEGEDIVLTKWIGLEGTTLLAKVKEEELQKRLPKAFIKKSQGLQEYLSVIPEAKHALSHGISSMHDLAEGGIFGGLWELAEASQVGIDVELKKLPILQETIEICEFFDLNPYIFNSGGSLLITTSNGHDLVKSLKAIGIESCVIGKVTSGKDRIIRRGEDCRYLERPGIDEIHKIL